MIRSFEVKPILARDINFIPEKLDRELLDLQSRGWKIVSVTPVNFKLWNYPKYHDAIKFVIIAEYEEDEIML